MKQQARPVCLFVGTAKAGTTSIEHALAKHEAIGIPRKETFYFDHDRMGGGALGYPQQRDMATVVTTEEEYLALYAPLADKLCLEIGTGYLYHHAASIPRILQTLGKDVRIGIVLRDPVERTWSAYMHFVKDLHEPLGFREAIAEEERRIAENWDFMWHYTAMSRYAAQVKAYQAAFSEVRVFFFEDLKASQEAFLTEVCEFVGVDPSGMPPKAEAYNPSGVPKYRIVQRFVTTSNPIKAILRPLWRMVVPLDRRRLARKYVKTRNLRHSEGLAPNDRAWLKDLYREDVAELGRLLDKDLFAKWNW